LNPFASPDNLDPEFQSFLAEANSHLCNWFSQAGKSGPLPKKILNPDIAPKIEGLKTTDLIKDLQIIMDGAYQPSHPGALAHLDPPPLTASIIADLICGGLNNNLLAEELSPTLSNLERLLCKWFCNRLSLPESAGGVAASGGSLSNLMALVVARQESGLQGNSEVVLLASEDAHVSLNKALRVMGLPSEALQKIPTNDSGQISLSLLIQKLNKLKSNGKKCFAVVATLGTTVRGAIDPLISLADICKKEGIWFHVDGAIGGIFALSEQTSHLTDGISLANSITLNPQKILGITKTSSLLLVSNISSLTNTFSMGIPYIEPTEGNLTNRSELGLQGTRSGEILKLWIGLRQLGQKGVEKILEEAISRREYFQKRLNSSKFDIIAGPLHLICFTPKDIDMHRSETWSSSIRNKLLSEKFMLSRPLYQKRYYIKAVMGNPHTTFQHLDDLAALINNFEA